MINYTFMPPLITLLSDFGSADGFPAAIKAAILKRLPVGCQQKWDCDDLSGLPRIEPDPKWDRRNALNVICRLDSGVALPGPPTRRAVT